MTGADGVVQRQSFLDIASVQYGCQLGLRGLIRRTWRMELLGRREPGPNPKGAQR